MYQMAGRATPPGAVFMEASSAVQVERSLGNFCFPEWFGLHEQGSAKAQPLPDKRGSWRPEALNLHIEQLPLQI